MVLSTAGDQLPAMPSLDVGGSVMALPLHTGPIGSKVGVIRPVMVISMLVGTPQLAASGVKV